MADSFAQNLQLCREAAESYEQAQSSSGNTDQRELAKQRCMERCSPAYKGKPANTYENGGFWVYYNKCFDNRYQCGNKSLCRAAVMDIHAHCKRDPSQPMCDTAQLASRCKSVCVVPTNQNCNPLDKEDILRGNDLCSTSPARPLISDARAVSIMADREEDVDNNNGVPTRQSSFRSVFFGDIPTPTSRPAPTGNDPNNRNPTEATEIARANRPPVGDEQAPTQTSTANNATAGAAGDSSGGGSMGSFGGGGGSGSSFAGGFGSSGPSGGGSEVTGGGGNTGTGSSVIGKGAPALGSDALSGSGDGVGGGRGGGAASARTASVPAAGGLLPGASLAGRAALGAGAVSPASATGTAGAGGPRTPGSINNPNFNSQFHGAGGAQSPQAIAALKKQNEKNKKKRGRRGSGDSLNAIMSSIWGKKGYNPKRMPAHSTYQNPEIGRGLHDVFRPVTNYFNNQPLEEDGSLAE